MIVFGKIIVGVTGNMVQHYRSNLVMFLAAKRHVSRNRRASLAECIVGYRYPSLSYSLLLFTVPL